MRNPLEQINLVPEVAQLISREAECDKGRLLHMNGSFSMQPFSWVSAVL